MTQVRQYELVDSQGSRLICWLDASVKLPIGSQLTLEELKGRRWTVVAWYPTVVDKQSLHKPWKIGQNGDIPRGRR